MAKYPNVRSAVLPLLFLVQSIKGWVTEAGMRDVGRLVGITPAQVLATGSFYTMLKKRPQGEYLISVCRNITCTHMGARRVIHSLEDHLGVRVGDTTPDGKFTLETAECLATCDGGPSAQINYEDVYNLTPESAIEMIDQLATGRGFTTFRGAEVKTSKEISYETAMSGAGFSALGEHTARTVSGEVLPPDMAPGFRPKVEGATADVPAAEAQQTESQEAPADETGPVPADADSAASQGSPGDAHAGSAEEEEKR
jgi:NADH-quinone oxidoreductase subunit E